MRGFLAGSLAAVALYALTQGGAADRLSGGAGVLERMLIRALSPDVAGVPARATHTGGRPAQAAPSSAPPVTTNPQAGRYVSA